MLRPVWRRRALAVLVACACTSLNAADFVHPDHDEFNAVLSAPFSAKAGRWPIALQFDYPYAGQATRAAWALDAVAPDGTVVRSWRGVAPLAGTRGTADVVWDADGDPVEIARVFDHLSGSLAFFMNARRVTVDIPQRCREDVENVRMNGGRRVVVEIDHCVY